MDRNIRFKSPAHRARFLESLVTMDKVEEGTPDVDYAAALYILTADIATFAKAQAYMSSNGILFARLLADIDFSEGSRVLIKLAGNLFSGEQHVDPLEMMILDEANLQVAFSAILIRRFNFTMEDLSM